ncbi:DUF2065 domain-containing protein [Sphingosinicella microcystinivorans]|uniref:DUF2065 domain-containing protein n=1 Tax=Sphingosinicella microcystinivorans TaxID=335406 RepID=A0AAD1D375_SPHMI|nr:DUF2065 domain-containing protein [Sphingosinicella microcystinivorans]RKS89174.1 hypothetical protein DFR51_2388 [Sphingosinicella microcystinivorans]BBE32931.1 hypothetical protein SmB9_05890 [Sphingosinicella microcystinivorans]
MGNDLLAAIGLALVLEGAAHALFPDAMRRAAAMLFARGESTVRIAGLGAVFAGVAIVAAVRLQG